MIAAVRDSRAPAAWGLLRGADTVAGGLAVVRSDFHTSFGPTNVRLRGVYVGAGEGDIAEAGCPSRVVCCRGQGTTRYLVEVMHANCLSGDRYATWRMLRQTMEASPEEIQYFPWVR